MALREVDDGAPELPSEQWLHLDVSMGVAGDMLTGALLDLGLGEGPVRAALQAAGVFEVGLRAQEGTRRGIRGLEVAFVDDRGRPVESLARPAPKAPRGTRRPRLERGARQTPHPDRRPQEEAAEGLKEVDSEDLGAKTLTLTPTPAGPAASENDDQPTDGRRALIQSWMGGESASGVALLSLLADARLPPVTRALALKAMRRLVQAKAAVAGVDVDAIFLPGPGAVDAVCDIVAVAALVESLSPAMITSSVLPLSTAPVRIDGVEHPGPAPWTLACADGLRTAEVEMRYGCTTPTGAALVWALAHRVGPRSESTVQQVGCGLGGYDPDDRVNCCRAFLSPLPELTSSAGAAHASDMVALVGSFDPQVALDAQITDLVRAGARGASVLQARDDAGRLIQRLEVLVPTNARETLSQLLLRSPGCTGLMSLPARYQTLGFREVTVPLGSRHDRKTVRVTERLLEGEVIDFSAVEDDVVEVARASGLPPGQVRREALEAYHRLVGPAQVEGAES